MVMKMTKKITYEDNSWDPSGVILITLMALIIWVGVNQFFNGVPNDSNGKPMCDENNITNGFHNWRPCPSPPPPPDPTVPMFGMQTCNGTIISTPIYSLDHGQEVSGSLSGSGSYHQSNTFLFGSGSGSMTIHGETHTTNLYYFYEADGPGYILKSLDSETTTLVESDNLTPGVYEVVLPPHQVSETTGNVTDIVRCSFTLRLARDNGGPSGWQSCDEFGDPFAPQDAIQNGICYQDSFDIFTNSPDQLAGRYSIGKKFLVVPTGSIKKDFVPN